MLPFLGETANAKGPWVAQVKRNFLAALKERDRQFRFVGGCSANNLGGNPQSVGTRATTWPGRLPPRLGGPDNGPA